MTRKMSNTLVCLIILTGMLMWTGPAEWNTAEAAPIDELLKLDEELEPDVEKEVRKELALYDNTEITGAELSLLTTLTISKDMDVHSLDFLTEAPFLEQLYVEAHSDLDLSPLTKLIFIKVLSVEENNLSKENKAVIAELKSKGVRILYTNPVPETLSPIQVYVDYEPIAFTIDPVLVNGTTMVQFRPLFESFGLEVDWDNETRTVTGTKEKLLIQLVIDSKKAVVSGQDIELLQAPALLQDNTMIPLRFIGEATGRSVVWDGENRRIDIASTFMSQSFDALFANDTIYKGEMTDGVPNGTGKWLYRDEVLYEGQVKNGLLDGKGTLYDLNDPSAYYEGDFKNNRFDGIGKTVYDDGSYHFGSYSKGLKEGVGKAYATDGTLVYSGTFKDNDMTGRGNYFYGDFRYNGDMESTYFIGQGRLYYQNELVYDGQWYYDEKTQGKLYVDGILVYDGMFANDLPGGYGTYYSVTGELAMRGKLDPYSITGLAIVYMPDGGLYIGQVYQSLADGLGLMISADGELLYAGYFTDDKPDLNHEATLQTNEWIQKELTRRATFDFYANYYDDGSDENADEASLGIYLDSEEDLAEFQSWTEEQQEVFMNNYAQHHWEAIEGIEQCGIYIVYDDITYAYASISKDQPNDELEIELYPDGDYWF
ncbi:stalk domain-containing protein [Paenibacillus sp. HB172176]|uniref:stalk domain-containing protein n=1 Tax=Paenibacillus sp. HB172176 TaxID=2493690 RepID=UPI00143BEA88|nr:stalk domain-containing protein [Paenibacillus sp. HB172176]